jgi:cyclopropane fatty-acyl-phospholipid synthase-like methyltransferase
MKKYERAIEQNYSQKDLATSILYALESVGKEIKSHEDTSAFDEFHIRSMEATLEIAEMAGLTEGMKMLDLGSGLGGPARTLAAEFGCRVTGVDLVKEYITAAEMLTERLGQSSLVKFRQADMTDLPFNDGSFDGAWTIHTQMNIEDKGKLFNEVSRVLKPGGLFIIYEICAGPLSPPYFPVPWANDPSISFLITPEELRDILSDAGFVELQWRDVTPQSLKWFQMQLETLSSRPKDAPPPPGFNLLMGQSATEKLNNNFRNLKEDKIRVVQGVYQSGS